MKRIYRDRFYLATARYGYERGDETHLVSGARLQRQRGLYVNPREYVPDADDVFELNDHTFEEHRTLADGLAAAKRVRANDSYAKPVESIG